MKFVDKTYLHIFICFKRDNLTQKKLFSNKILTRTFLKGTENSRAMTSEQKLSQVR